MIIQINVKIIINMIKYIDDYIDNISKKYPKVSKITIKKILEYGFTIFYLLNNKGADIEIHNSNYTAYCGKLFIDNNKRSIYNNIKYRIKLRLLYKFNKNKYDGYYYIGLDDIIWNTYKNKILSNRKFKISLDNIKLFKIKEECTLNKDKNHFIKVYYPIDAGWVFYKDKLIIQNYKYIGYKDNTKNIIWLEKNESEVQEKI